jgi:hypothetical protein
VRRAGPQRSSSLSSATEHSACCQVMTPKRRPPRVDAASIRSVSAMSRSTSGGMYRCQRPARPPIRRPTRLKSFDHGPCQWMVLLVTSATSWSAE